MDAIPPPPYGQGNLAKESNRAEIYKCFFKGPYYSIGM